jgi:hypothetical protein
MHYAIAMQCAKMNNEGCSLDCPNCQFNVFNYVYDVREAALLKATAYTDFHNRNEINKRIKREESVSRAVPIFMLVVMIAIGAWVVSSFRSCLQPVQAQTQQQMNPFQEEMLRLFGAPQPNVDVRAEIEHFARNPNTLSNIPRILNVMNIMDVWDVNQDGLINCIDYSLVFRKLYGSNARIMINVNPNNGMNHMFIRVMFGGHQFIDVEPQGTPNRFSMGAVWGTRYDPMFNRDVTNQWTHVVGGMSR